MKTDTKNTLICLLLVGLAILVNGCHFGTKPVAWNVSVTKTTPASIEVDFIGVSPLEKPYWNDIKPDDYWRPNESTLSGSVRLATTNKITVNFQSTNTFVLQRQDPMWDDWFRYGATELMIMADLPGVYDNSPTDRRRLFLPLNSKIWRSKHHTLEIEIQDQFIRVLTPQRPQN